jgi:hypothetical protein
MARGFESKAVADQQEAAQATVPTRDTPEPDPAQLARRRRLELSRADVRRRLATATADAHREMLRRALEALEAEIASLR